MTVVTFTQDNELPAPCFRLGAPTLPLAPCRGLVEALGFQPRSRPCRGDRTGKLSRGGRGGNGGGRVGVGGRDGKEGGGGLGPHVWALSLLVKPHSVKVLGFLKCNHLMEEAQHLALPPLPRLSPPCACRPSWGRREVRSRDQSPRLSCPPTSGGLTNRRTVQF